MVSIPHYIGRAGNCIFQYVFARLLATKNGLFLNTQWEATHQNVFGTVENDLIKFTSTGSEGQHNETPVLEIDDQHRKPTRLDWLDINFQHVHIKIKGYFQHPIFYDKNKDLIKSWMILPAIQPGHENDIVVHLRLGDYKDVKRVPIISQKWYDEILKRPENAGKKIYLVMSPPKASWEIDYVNNLGFRYEMVNGTAAEDFNFIRSFGTIVCSNSSYCWWAAWLSNAKSIYTFDRWMIASPYVKLAQTQGMTPCFGKYIWE
jgi:hypothetical protein